MRVEQKVGNIWEWGQETAKQKPKASSKKRIEDDNPADFFAKGLFDEIPLSDDEDGNSSTNWYYEIRYQ